MYLFSLLKQNPEVEEFQSWLIQKFSDVIEEPVSNHLSTLSFT